MDYYDDIAEGYEELHGEEQESKMAKIISDVDSSFLPTKTDRVLDVGCGTGISTESWGGECVGIDPSIELIKIAQEKFKGDKKKKFILAKAEEIPFEDNFFDFVISVTSFQNFENIREAIKEIKRVGKKKFLFTVLRKSPKIEFIEKLIIINFKVKKIIMEKKDIIFVCESLT